MSERFDERWSRDEDARVVERPETRRPRLYMVLMHNDDYTYREFVVHVLMRFFGKSETDATQLMLKVHITGMACVGVYTRDIAETKVEQVTSYARDNGMPLRLTAEPED